MRRTAAVAVVIGLLAWGCGDGDGSPTTAGTEATQGSIATTETPVTTSEPAREPAAGWASLLDRIPATDETIAYVMMNDYAAAATAAGVVRPGPAAGDDAIAEYVMSLSMGPTTDAGTGPGTRSQSVAATFDTFGQAMPDPAAWEAAFGFDVLDVDRAAVAGFPPNELIVWEGSIGTDVVAGAVASDPVWSGRLATVADAAAPYYRWGEDPGAVDPELRDSVRPLGRGGCLAAFDGVALRTFHPDIMEAALAAQAGERTTLAEIEPLRLIAAALDAEDTYAAYLTADTGQFIPDPNLVGGGSGEQATLNPYLALGTGAGIDQNGEPYMVLVLVHEDADGAETNAAALEQIATTGASAQAGVPWSELLTVRSIEADGPLVVAVFDTPSRARLWYQVVITRDSLLTWS